MRDERRDIPWISSKSFPGLTWGIVEGQAYRCHPLPGTSRSALAFSPSGSRPLGLVDATERAQERTHMCRNRIPRHARPPPFLKFAECGAQPNSKTAGAFRWPMVTGFRRRAQEVTIIPIHNNSIHRRGICETFPHQYDPHSYQTHYLHLHHDLRHSLPPNDSTACLAKVTSKGNMAGLLLGTGCL